MSKRLANGFAASLAINIALVAIGRGSLHQLIAIILALGIALSCFPFGLLLLGFGGKSPAQRQAAFRFVALGVVAGSTIISLPIGSFLNRYDIEQAKSFCDRLRPALERQRSEKGRYPKHLSEVFTGKRLPRLLRDGEFYSSDHDRYSFSFTDPSGMMNGFEFDSNLGHWNEWD